MNQIRESIESDILALTSREAAGRLAGSDGAHFAARHLASRLAEQNIEAAGDDDYFAPVTLLQSRVVSKPRLIVNGIELAHRQQFALRNDHSSSADARGALQVVSPDRDLAADAIRDRFLLLTDRLDTTTLGEIAAVARDEGAKGIFVREPSRRGWLRKSVRHSSLQLPVVALTPVIAAVLEENRNVAIELRADIESGETSCRNVLGMIRGGLADGRTILLSAHYDHVGDDPDGQRYPGAFDNASGVATVMATARELVRRRDSLGANVLIAFFTGEESGFWGARALLESRKFEISAAINVDGVGSEPLRAIRVGDGNGTVRETASRVVASRGAEPRNIGGKREDSSVFRRAGIPTVAFGQEPVDGDLTFMHSPDDRPEALDRTAIEAMVGIVTEVVEQWSRQPAEA